MNLANRIFALRNLAPFRVLYDSEIAAIARAAIVHEIDPGSVVLRPGQRVRYLYLTVRGSLVSSTGERLPTAWGHRELVAGESVVAEVRAHPDEGATCLGLTDAHFFTIVHESPSVLVTMLANGAGEDA